MPLTTTYRRERLTLRLLFAVLLAGISITPVRADSSIFYGNSFLWPDSGWYSPSGQVVLWYQGAGNLSLWVDGNCVWNTPSAPADDANFAVMQTDGNFVAYDSNTAAYWHTGTWGNEGAYLAVQDDGHVVLYNAEGAPLWSIPQAPPPPPPPPPTLPPAPAGTRQVWIALWSTKRIWLSGPDHGHAEWACKIKDLPYQQCAFWDRNYIDGIYLQPEDIDYINGEQFLKIQGSIDGPYNLVGTNQWEWDDTKPGEETNRPTRIALMYYPFINWAGYPTGLTSTAKLKWDESDPGWIFQGGNDDFDWQTGQFGGWLESCLMRGDAYLPPSGGGGVTLESNVIDLRQHNWFSWGDGRFLVYYDVVCGWR